MDEIKEENEGSIYKTAQEVSPEAHQHYVKVSNKASFYPLSGKQYESSKANLV